MVQVSFRNRDPDEDKLVLDGVQFSSSFPKDCVEQALHGHGCVSGRFFLALHVFPYLSLKVFPSATPYFDHHQKLRTAIHVKLYRNFSRNCRENPL